jgi:hypothetical protein
MTQVQSLTNATIAIVTHPGSTPMREKAYGMGRMVLRGVRAGYGSGSIEHIKCGTD